MAELTPEQLKEQIALTKKYAAAIEGAETAQARLRDRATDTVATFQQQLSALEGQAHSTQKVVAQQEIAVGIARENLNLMEASGTATADQIAKQRALVAGLAEGVTVLKESVGAAKQLGTSLAGAFRLSGVGNYSDKLGSVVTALKRADVSAGEFFTSLSSGLAAAAFDSIVGLAVKLVDTESAFRKATGASTEYARSVTRTYEATRQYGVSTEEASAATMSLYRSFTDFTLSSARVQASLRETASIMGELGVSNESFAQTTQMATKMLGVSAGQMQNTTREIATYAQEMNMDMGQMFQQLGQAGPQLAKYGEQGIDTFKRLQHVFKITGLEMNKVLQMTSKFDTFEGAARQAGMLNAALGSNMVNAMELMQETDPVGRFQMLRNAILDTGLTFDKMSYYQKIFYRDALGLSDVGDLALMLSGDMRNLAGATQKNSKEWAEFKNQAASVQSLMDLFQATVASMVPVLEPAMNMIKSFFTYLNSDGGKWLRLAVQGFIMWKVATKTLGLAFGGLTIKLLKFIKPAWAAKFATDGLGAAFSRAAKGVAKLGIASMTTIPVILSIAAVFGAVGLAAAGIGYAISKVSDVFSSMTETLREVIPAAAGLASMFSTMGNTAVYTTAVAGLKTVKAELAAIQALAPNGQLELTKAMDSVSRAANPKLDHAGLKAAIEAISTGGGGGGGGGAGGEDYHHVPIDLSIGGTRFETYVLKIVGDKISQIHREQAKT